MKKVRLDDLLVSRGYAESARQALAMVMAGQVLVREERASHVGAIVAPDIEIRVIAERSFVSRGGYKLDTALDRFDIDVAGVRAIDIGASTGGFTDVLLKRGAASVVALDVGYGQLDWSLRSDERVTTLDRTNVKDVDPEGIGAPFDLLVTDVSFIPLASIAGQLVSLVRGGGDVVALVKPQFELERSAVGERGVVSDPAAHIRSIERAVAAFSAAGAGAVSIWFSPITGPEGNIEFLLHARKGATAPAIDIESVVGRAHREFGG